MLSDLGKLYEQYEMRHSKRLEKKIKDICKDIFTGKEVDALLAMIRAQKAWDEADSAAGKVLQKIKDKKILAWVAPESTAKFDRFCAINKELKEKEVKGT